MKFLKSHDPFKNHAVHRTLGRPEGGLNISICSAGTPPQLAGPEHHHHQLCILYSVYSVFLKLTAACDRLCTFTFESRRVYMYKKDVDPDPVL